MRIYCQTYFWKGTIYEIGVQDGVKFIERLKYEPTVYIASTTQSGLKDLYGNYVKPILVQSVKKYAREHDNEFFAGDVKETYQYIREYYPDKITDIPTIPTASFDLEIEKDKITGYSTVEEATNRITSISIHNPNTDKKIVLSYDKLKKEHNFKYIQCINEHELLTNFWRLLATSVIITGWNIKNFDIPYLINRSERLGVDLVDLLPLGKKNEKRTHNKQTGKEEISYEIPGYAIYDYLPIFKQYNFDTQHSFKLDSIAKKYLDDSKVDYIDKYKNLDNLFEEDLDLFLDYNIKDCTLVSDIDKKFGYIKLALTISYMCKINIDEVFGTIKPWDVMLYNKFMDIGIVKPRTKSPGEPEPFEGAFVKKPVPGFYDWVASFDVNSMYPNLLVSGRFTPFSVLSEYKDVYIDKLLENKVDDEIFNNIKEQNVSMSACGFLFKKQDDPICNIVEEIYNARVEFKNKAKKEKYPIQKNIYKQYVQALKILINSLYGAFASPYFFLYDLRIARSITTTGQYLIQQVSNNVNIKFNNILKTNKIDYCVYNDTDSSYFRLNTFIEKFEEQKNIKLTKKEKLTFCTKICNTVIEPEIEKSLQELSNKLNFYKNNLVMGREKIADKGLFIGKKNYILRVVDDEGDVIIDEPDIMYKGIKLIKTTTPKVIQNDVDVIIRQLFDVKSENDFKEIINKYKEIYKNVKIEDLSIYTSVNNLGKYKPKVDKKTVIWVKGTPIHVRAAWVYNIMIEKLKLQVKYEKLSDGQKVRYVFLKEPNHLKTKVLGIPEGYDIPEEFNIKNKIDYNTQLDKVFINNFDTITKRLGWDIKSLLVVESLF
jgi:Kyanoviridae DNA polymerase